MVLSLSRSAGGGGWAHEVFQEVFEYRLVEQLICQMDLQMEVFVLLLVDVVLSLLCAPAFCIYTWLAKHKHSSLLDVRKHDYAILSLLFFYSARSTRLSADDL